MSAGGGSDRWANISAAASSRRNGGSPASSSNAEQASAYWSARPSTARPWICSGAVYSSVPRNWPVPVSPVAARVALLSPKSDRYT